MRRKRPDDFPELEAIQAIAHVLQEWSGLVEERRSETQKDIDRFNFGLRLRVMLQLFRWDLILIPLAIASDVGWSKHLHGQYLWRVRIVYVFGFRVARWVVGKPWFAAKPLAPRTKPARLRVGRNRRKRCLPR